MALLQHFCNPIFLHHRQLVSILADDAVENAEVGSNLRFHVGGVIDSLITAVHERGQNCEGFVKVRMSPFGGFMRPGRALERRHTRFCIAEVEGDAIHWIVSMFIVIGIDTGVCILARRIGFL